MLGAELGIGLGDFGQVVVEDALLAVQGAHFQPAADAHLLFIGTFKKQVAEFEYLLRWQILPWLRFPSLHEALH